MLYFVPDYKLNDEVVGTYEMIKNEAIIEMPEYAYNYCLDLIKKKNTQDENKKKL